MWTASGEGGGEEAEGEVGVGGGEGEGGDEAEDGFARGDAEEAGFAELQGEGGGFFLEDEADHQAEAADRFHAVGMGGGDASEALDEIGAGFAGVLQEILPFDDAEGRQGGGAGQRRAAEGRGVVAGLEDVGEGGGGGGGADGEAAAEGLGHGKGVGLDVVVLPAEPAAGAPDAALDFVAEQEQSALVAELAEAAHEFGGGGEDAAFALDGFDEDGGGLGGEGRADGVEVVEVGVGEAGDQGLEPVLVLRLAGGGHRGEGASVEGIAHGDDAELALGGAPFAGEFEEAFVGFGAGIAEEDLAAETGDFGDFRGEAGLDFVDEEVGAVHEAGGLVADGGDDVRVAVAGVADGDAGHAVEVFLAGFIPEAAVLAADHDGAGLVGGHDEAGVEVRGGGGGVIHWLESPFRRRCR